ncbi:MAG: TIGR00529 family membrane protein, partial [Thermotogae bacterium]
SSLGLNVILVAVILPIVVGMSTGITQTTVGISLPIVLGMGGANLALLTYVFSVAGVLLSPVHLCLVLTSQYFNVNFLQVLQKISLPLAITCFVGWLYLI